MALPFPSPLNFHRVPAHLSRSSPPFPSFFSIVLNRPGMFSFIWCCSGVVSAHITLLRLVRSFSLTIFLLPLSPPCLPASLHTRFLPCSAASTRLCILSIVRSSNALPCHCPAFSWVERYVLFLKTRHIMSLASSLFPVSA